MKKAIFYAAIGAAIGAFAALADLALVASPAEVSGVATNAVTMPRGATGWAEVDIVAAATPTNSPAVYTLATLDASGSNAVPVFGVSPLTNAAAVASIPFRSAAVNGTLYLVTEPGPSNVTRAAVLRYTQTYPR